MKPSLWKSRKFWIVVVDALISIATMCVTTYVVPDKSAFILGVIAVLQPVIYALVNGITKEDVAYLENK